MSSKFYVPGPSNVFAQVGASSAYVQLGWTESNVRIVTGVKHQEVNADYSAGMAADQQMMGEEVMVSFRLSRYFEAVLTLCKTRLGSSLSAGPGSGLAGALGALLLAEQNTYGLVIQSQYATKAVFSDMLPAIYIPKAYMADSTEVELGMGVKMPQVVFRGIATYGLDGSYSLFSSNVSGLTLPAVA